MPQGWTNAPSELHQFKDDMLRPFPRKELSFSYDDTIMYSGDLSQERFAQELEHLHLLRRFFEACRKHGNFLAVRKLVLFRDKVKHQGFLVGHGVWEKDPDAVAPILALPMPKTKYEMRQAIGMLSTSVCRTSLSPTRGRRSS